MYKGCWLKAQTKSMVIPDANLTNCYIQVDAWLVVSYYEELRKV